MAFSQVSCVSLRKVFNNLTVNSVMDEDYDDYFGFTRSEVHEMLEYYGAMDKEPEMKNWMELRNDGVKNILKLGIAFSGKKVKIKTK